MNKNNRGFSLIEVLVAVAALGGLSIAGMQLYQNQVKGQKTVETNYEVTAIVQQLRTVLSNPTNCAVSFVGLNPSSATPTFIRKEVNSAFEEVYRVDDQQPGNIRIRSYNFNKTYPGMASNETMLVVNFSRGPAAIKDQTQKALKIVYTADGSGNILTCHAFNNNNDDFWVQSMAQPHDIYYAAGNVGVGVVNPSAKLDVGGAIKVGPAADTCAAAQEGHQRYNSTLKAMQFCNGSVWASMGGAGMDFTPMNSGLTWTLLQLPVMGAGGNMAGAPNMPLGTLGGDSYCGPVSTVTLTTPGITSSTKAALISFSSHVDSAEESPAMRVFAMDETLAGMIGQAGRGGDGRSFGAGGEVVVPLTGGSFKIQFCRRENRPTRFWYAVKGFGN